MANRPTSTGMMSKPLTRFFVPKENRAKPSTESRPTQEMNRPMEAEIRPLKIFFALRIMMMDRPNSASAKRSAAPNFSAACASCGAKKISIRALMMPAIVEATSAVSSALLA